MPSIRFLKATIGGPESTPGTAVAREYVIPVRSVLDLDKTSERALDPAIIGRNMDPDDFSIAEDIAGSIPISPRACGGWGMLLKGCLGAEEVVQGYQEMGLTGKTGSSDTLLTAATAYNFKMTVDGGTQTNCSVTTGAGPTIDYDELLGLLNAEMTSQSLDCTWYIWGGDLRCVSDSKNSPSTIDIAEGDTSGFLAALDGGATPDTAVAGTVIQIAGCLRVMYTGSSASCKLESDQSENTLTSSIGNKGSESPDSNFGTTGVVDFDLAAYDTLGEAVTAINGFTDYSCEKVTGADSLDLITGMVEHGILVQAKGMWAYIYFISSTSGVYRHIISYDISAAELPNYTIQKDGYQDNFLYDGNVIDTISLSASLKAMAEAEASCLGFTEAIGQTESALTLEDVDPFIFHDGSTTLGEYTYTYVRNISTDFNNNSNPDGYGQGLITRQYHQKGKFDAMGEFQLRLDATSYAERAKVFSGADIAVSYWFKGKEFSTDLDELMIIEMPYCKLQNYTFTENAGQFDCNVQFKAFYPKGTIYNNPVRCHLLTQDSDEY